MKSETIHKALNLPSGYHAKTAITGQVRVGDAHHEQRLVELRLMTTDTHGQEAVHAVRVVNGDGKWKEINSTAFTVLAIAIVNGSQIDVKNQEAWGLK